MSDINLFEFLVEKPFIWAECQLFGKKVEDVATSQIIALEPAIIAFLMSTLNAKIKSLILADGTLNVDGVSAALAPEVSTLASDAIADVANGLNLSSTITLQLQAYAVASIPALITDAFSAVGAALSDQAALPATPV